MIKLFKKPYHKCMYITLLFNLFLSGCNTGSNYFMMTEFHDNNKEIIKYSLKGQNHKLIDGNITDHNISVTMPFGSTITDLVAKYSTTGKSVTVNGNPQTSEVTHNNFESTIDYVVTAQDGSTATYKVMVAVAESSAKEIIKYSFKGQNNESIDGSITDHNISVTMPFGSTITDLVAKYSTTGKSVTVNGNPQTSDVTHNNFESTIKYAVTAQDGSTATYVVMVTVPKELFSCIADPVTSNACGCLAMNDGSRLIWYADGSKTGTWDSWCSHTGTYADSKCNKDGASLITFNSENHCGYNNWHLPNATNLGNGTSGDTMGGNWGMLASYAKNNGWAKGTSFSKWLMNPSSGESGINHFTGIQPQNYYWSTVSADDDDINAWCLATVLGTEYEGDKSATNFDVLLVRDNH